MHLPVQSHEAIYWQKNLCRSIVIQLSNDHWMDLWIRTLSGWKFRNIEYTIETANQCWCPHKNKHMSRKTMKRDFRIGIIGDVEIGMNKFLNWMILAAGGRYGSVALFNRNCRIISIFALSILFRQFNALSPVMVGHSVSHIDFITIILYYYYRVYLELIDAYINKTIYALLIDLRESNNRILILMQSLMEPSYYWNRN